MTLAAKRASMVLAVVSVFLTLISCSSTPNVVKMGSPAYYWQGAVEVYASGDYLKTLEHLDNLLATENEFTARALPWALVLKSGMAAGYADIATNYEVGARMNRSDPLFFRRQVSENRDAAGRMALRFAEDYGKFANLKGETVSLAFSYPRGSAAPVPQFTKVTNGIPLQAADHIAANQHAIERGVLLAVCRASGAPDDAAKTEQVLKAGNVTVPRATFLMATAEALYEDSQLYVRDKLDQPQKMEIFATRALDALKGVPESKETKALETKIQAALKKLNK